MKGEQRDRGNTERLNLTKSFVGGNAGREKHSGWGVRSTFVPSFGNRFMAFHKSLKLHP